jgi:hypothetical protein
MSRKFVGLSGIAMCAEHWATQSPGWVLPCVPPKHPCGGSESCATEHLHSQARTAPTNEVSRAFVVNHLPAVDIIETSEATDGFTQQQ